MAAQAPVPTRAQTLALDLSRNLAVTAGAGTGKTWVLTRRYIDILDRAPEPVTPERILAVTFTEKAAHEMRDRITSEIGKKIAAARTAGDLDALRRWTLHRRGLPAATIATIHSFAAQVVQSYALEAGIDPDRTIIQGPARDRLARDAVHAAIFATADDVRQRLAESLAVRDARTVEDLLRHLLGKRTFADAWADALDENEDDALLAGFVRSFSPFDEAAADAALAQVADAARPLLASPMRPPDGTKAAAFFALLASCAASTQAPFLDKAAALRALWEHCTTGEGKPYDRAARHHAFGKKELWAQSGGVDRAHGLLDAVDALFAGLLGGAPFPLLPGPLDRLLLRDMRALASVYRDARDRYAAAKEERGALDFDDLQEIAARLMQRDWIARDLRQRFRYLLVDEFQDTDALQWRIVQALARLDIAPAHQGPPDPASAWRTAGQLFGGKGERDAALYDIPTPPPAPLVLGPDGLFIVGDEKQAIYAFRGADVNIYHDSRTAIVAANRHHGALLNDHLLPPGNGRIHASEAERLGEIALETNFRSLPELVAFGNRLFDKLLIPDGATHEPHEARPGPLVAKRTDIGFHGTIRLMVDPKKGRAHAPDDEDAETTDASVWRRLVERIRDDVEGDHPLRVDVEGDDRTRSVRRATYDDLAVLVARRRPIPDIVRELRALGIPYTVAGGRGFWDAQEVWDLIGMLAFLSDPQRDVDLVGLMRSPFFAWTDRALLRLFRAEGYTAWERLRNLDGAADVDMPLAPADVASLLDGWIARSGAEPPSVLLQEVLDTTGYVASLGPDDRARQVVHNIDKLRGVIRDLEARFGPHPAAIVRELEHALDAELDEGEANVPTEAGHGVVIMTVHGAKGLEFPVVYVPELDRTFRFGHFPAGFRGGTVAGVPLVAGKVRAESGELERPGLWEILGKQDEHRGRAELKRLLYVAVTRARDHLVLQGASARRDPEAKLQHAAPPPIARARSWMDWVEHCLGIDATTYQGGPLQQIPFGEVSVTLDLRPPTGYTHAGAASTGQPAIAPPLDPPVRSWRKRAIVLTPSSMELLAHCPRRFFHRVVEGLTEPRRDRASRRTEDHATLIGDLVHQALEVGATTGSPVPASVARRGKRRAAALGRNADDTLRFVAEHVRRALAAVSPADIVLHEVSFTRSAGDDIRIVGRIDRLAHAEGGWDVIDYKTDAVTGDASLHAHQAGHGMQAELYRRVAGAASSHLLYTGTGETVAVETDAIDDVVERVRSAAQDGASGDETAWPMAPARDACGGCGFWRRRGGPCTGWSD